MRQDAGIFERNIVLFWNVFENKNGDIMGK
jgi:hypothetical protein